MPSEPYEAEFRLSSIVILTTWCRPAQMDIGDCLGGWHHELSQGGA
jgi:hypothetical protein